MAKYQVSSTAVSKLVEAYLLHYTYDKTLAKLAMTSGTAGAGSVGAGAAGEGKGGANGAESEEMRGEESKAEGDEPKGGKAGGEEGSGGGGGDAARATAPVSSGPSPHCRIAITTGRTVTAAIRIHQGTDTEAAATMESGGEGDTGTAAGDKMMMETLELRRTLRARVLGGDIEGAFGLCEGRCPGLLSRHRDAHFLLLCQGFIEVREGRR